MLATFSHFVIQILIFDYGFLEVERVKTASISFTYNAVHQQLCLSSAEHFSAGFAWGYSYDCIHLAHGFLSSRRLAWLVQMPTSSF